MIQLFTVFVREDGTINIDFSEEVSEIVSEEELKRDLNETMKPLIPIVVGVANYLKTKI